MPVRKPLALELEQLLNPAVRDVDPEDMFLDETRAQVDGAEETVGDIDPAADSGQRWRPRSTVRPRSLRRRQLPDLGPRYCGRTVNRADINSDCVASPEAGGAVSDGDCDSADEADLFAGDSCDSDSSSVAVGTTAQSLGINGGGGGGGSRGRTAVTPSMTSRRSLVSTHSVFSSAADDDDNVSDDDNDVSDDDNDVSVDGNVSDDDNDVSDDDNDVSDDDNDVGGDDNVSDDDNDVSVDADEQQVDDAEECSDAADSAEYCDNDGGGGGGAGAVEFDDTCGATGGACQSDSMRLCAVSDDVAKGGAIRTQLNVWDQLLECRIKLQPAVAAVQQLPDATDWQHFWRQQPTLSGQISCHTSEQLNDRLAAALSDANRLAKQLQQLETAVLAKFPETASLAAQLESADCAPSADSAPSSDSAPSADCAPSADAAESDQCLQQQQQQQQRPSAKRHSDDSAPPDTASGAGVLKRRRLIYSSYRDSVVQQWDERVRVLTSAAASSGGSGGVAGAGGGGSRQLLKAASFGAFECRSALQQVEQLLADRQRLVHRTQLRRTQTHVLGCDSQQQQQSPADTGAAAGVKPDSIQQQSQSGEQCYDSEVFDDTDFYHHLLRELIERKTASVTDPVTLGRHWVGAQKLHTSVKKHVDTRASKGRKVRYEVYPKLVNFMAAVSSSCLTGGGQLSAVDRQLQLARDSVLASLFGQRRAQVTCDPVTVVNRLVTPATGM